MARPTDVAVAVDSRTPPACTTSTRSRSASTSSRSLEWTTTAAPPVGRAPKAHVDVSRRANVESARRILGDDEMRSVGRARARERASADCRPRERAPSSEGPRLARRSQRIGGVGGGAFGPPVNQPGAPTHAPQRQVLDERKVQHQSHRAVGLRGRIRSSTAARLGRALPRSVPRAREAARAVRSPRQRRCRGSRRHGPRTSRPGPPRLRVHPAPRRASVRAISRFGASVASPASRSCPVSLLLVAEQRGGERTFDRPRRPVRSNTPRHAAEPSRRRRSPALRGACA